MPSKAGGTRKARATPAASISAMSFSTVSGVSVQGCTASPGGQLATT
jgi:hypothetical protein